MNQQLLRRLQGQVVLEAEVSRLRTLLSDFRVKIESELGTFPYQSPCSGNIKEGNCIFQPHNAGITVHCETEVTCPHAPLETSRTAASQNGDTLPWEGICEISNPNC
ncbi:hypothetical protein SUGI_0709760 [Cryptomeria japonica]|nr:hypothetical protein SUGI_0709760 [Cryptomeria japonica]